MTKKKTVREILEELARDATREWINIQRGENPLINDIITQAEHDIKALVDEEEIEKVIGNLDKKEQEEHYLCASSTQIAYALKQHFDNL